MKGWSPETLERLGVYADNGRLVFSLETDDGTPVGAVRYSPNGATPKMLAEPGTTRELWPRPEIIAGDTLYVVEGEPDAVSMAELGLPAVAYPGTGKFSPEWPHRLVFGPDGRRQRIVFLPDCDDGGRQKARQFAAAVDALGVPVYLADLYPGRDDGYDVGDALVDFGAEMTRRLVEQVAGRAEPVHSFTPPAERYAVTFKDRKLVLPEVPEQGDDPGHCAWLTSVLHLDPARPIIGAVHEGAGPDGHVELRRAGAPTIRFEPASALNTAHRLCEALSWQTLNSDEEPYGLSNEHARHIVFVVRRLCGPPREAKAAEEARGIVGSFAFGAEAVEGYTTYGTVPQRYEAAIALRRDLDSVSGRPLGPPRYLVDSETGELVIRVSDLVAAARAYTGGPLRRGWLDARMEHIGWERVMIDAHADEGRDGRLGPHVRAGAYRGRMTTEGPSG